MTSPGRTTRATAGRARPRHLARRLPAALLCASVALAPAAPRARVVAAPVAAPFAVRADASVDACLPLHAQRLVDAGAPLQALELLGASLRAAWRATPEGLPADGRADEHEIALLQLEALAGELSAWPETLALCEALADAAPAALPHDLAFRLGHLHAEALRQTGRSAEARERLDAFGPLRELALIGPFDNERGGGLRVAWPPEVAIDLQAEVPGKERPVRWRDNPVAGHPLARIHLGDLLRPERQALAYVATAIFVEQPRDVVLRLGSTGGLAVICNGVELLSRNVERPLHADQDRVVLPLQPGWNRLLVKSGVEDGRWVLQARLTDLDGAPLTDLHLDASRLDERHPAPAPARGAPPPGLRERLEAAARGEGEGALRAAKLLAHLHLLVHPDDVVDRSARAAAERALALAPDDTEARYLLARGSEREGASAEEAEVNRRLTALSEVLAAQPGHVAALLDLAEYSLRDSPRPERAGQLTARALAEAPSSWRALMLRAEWLGQRDRDVERELLQRAALQSPEAAVRDGATLLRAEFLLREGRPDEALALLEESFARRSLSSEVVDRLVDLAAQRGRLELVRQAAARLLDTAPGTSARLLRPAERLEYAGDVDGAGRLLDRALAACPELVEAYEARTRLAERRGDTASALLDLAERLRLKPGDDKARRHLEALADEGERERFEDPWRFDAAELLALPLPQDGDEPVECLDRTTVWRVQSDGTEHLYEHLVLRVLSGGGVKLLDEFVVPSWGDDVPYVHQVRVLRADGSSERATRRGRRCDLPPLRVGDLVDIEYRLDQRRPDVFGEYFGTRHEFYPDLYDGKVPVRRARLAVIAPPDVPLHAAEQRGERLTRSRRTDAAGMTVLEWEARDLPRPPEERAMPSRSEIAPVVDITTFESWDAFARWWWALIEKEFVTTPEMRAKVAQLVEGLDTEAQRVQAIARFVGQEIRYNAWPFGTHGYEPFSAATIFERRFGDCKDKSILLRQMLAEIGVEAQPVLIKAEYARAEESLDAAMVGHFNHCIAYLPATPERPGYYLDATADRNPVDYLRADDQGARVLHVSERGGELHEIPWAPPEQNRLVRRWTLRLDAQGAGEVELRDESNGQYGVQLRYRYGGAGGQLNARLASDLAGSFGQVDIASASTSDLQDIGAPAWLEARFGARSLWTAEGPLRTLRLGFDELGLMPLVVESESERSFDLVLDRPFAHDTVVRWELPPGAVVERLPPDVLIEEPGLLRYRQSTRQAGSAVEVERRFELYRRRIPQAEYGTFRRLVREIDLAETRSVALRPAVEEGAP